MHSKMNIKSKAVQHNSIFDQTRRELKTDSIFHYIAENKIKKINLPVNLIGDKNLHHS
jgi:hypothetical protein